MRTLSVLFLLAAALAVPAVSSAQSRPVIERIEPTSGPPGTQVQIIGRNFQANADVLIGETEMPVVRRLPGRWTVRVPGGASSGPVQIVNPDGRRFRGPYFRVTAARPDPVISDIDPDQGAPGTEVTISGENFSPRLADNRVTLSQRPVVVRSATPTSLEVIVPSGASTGPFHVEVEQAGAADSEPFTVLEATAITEFQPRIGPPGTQVTITGTGFSADRRDNRVYLNNARAQVDQASPTQLVVTLPRRAASGKILVDVRGAGRAETSEEFRIQYPPQIRRFRPEAAPPGHTVRIDGSHFGEDPRHVRVTLAGRPVVLREVSPRRIEVEIPSGARTGKLAVTVNGLGPAESDGELTVLEPVAIRDFTPRSGPAGTVVTIRGQGFSEETDHDTVLIGNARAQVVAASTGELRIRVPSASSGPITVRVDGSGEDSSSRPFVVTHPPLLASFSPAEGGPGTEVTIRGRSFGDNANLLRVTLSGRPMEVESVSDQQIVAKVPEGARTGRIAVTVRLQGTSTADEDFEVAGTTAEQPDEQRPELTVTGVSARCHRPGCHAVIEGTGFGAHQADNRVFFGGRPVRVEMSSATRIRVALPQISATHPFRVEIADVGAAQSGPFTIGTTTDAGGETGEDEGSGGQ